ncbi:MAG TPA: hypothetical protein VE690_06405 [Rhodopila sp.]|nr:hypothetical protein [Rhodopila sp.]
MSAKRPFTAPDHSTVASVQPPALGVTDLRAMAEALFDVAPTWTTELQGICLDEASLIITPDGAEDLLGPSFILSRDSFGYRVDQVHWDAMTEVGAFTSFSDAVSAIRHQVSQWAPGRVPVNVTRH